MLNKIKHVLLAALLAWSLQLVPAQAAQHPFGSNIITPQGTVFTITHENNQTVRRPYTSPGAFLSFSFNSWENIVGASAEDLALPLGSLVPPRDGKVICSDRGADKGTCYLITSGKKAGFTSAEVFLNLGYSFNNAASGDVSFLPTGSNISSQNAAHNAGSLINKDGTVYLVDSSGLVGIPSWQTLTSWGYSPSDIVPANSADVALPAATSTLKPRPAENLQVLDSNSGRVFPGLTSAESSCTNCAINITNLNLPSGPVGTSVIITGSGFTATGNTIKFDIYSFTNVSSANNGTILTFTVPAQLYYNNNNCSAGTICPMIMARETTPGNYNVTVSNSNGTSNTMTFTVTNPDIALQCEYAAPPVGYHYEGGGLYPLCGAHLVQDGSVQASPLIFKTTPTSGPVGTSVIITGSGFTPTGNQVRFGNTGSEYNPSYRLNSSDGQTIIFNVPSSNYYACQNSAPACNPPNTLTEPDDYAVSVVNANGTSNALTFTVTTANVALQCEYAAPPVGYHYEGGGLYPLCGAHLVQDGSVQASPLIFKTTPTSGPVGTSVIITGSGFTPTGNTIKFDIYSFTNVSSANNGTILTFTVPAQLYYNNCTTGIICPNIARETTPGDYNVIVSNSNGTSNEVAFTVK